MGPSKPSQPRLRRPGCCVADRELAELRWAVIVARAAYQRREITLKVLYDIADIYREALAARAPEIRKKTGRRFHVPSRAYLLRAL